MKTSSTSSSSLTNAINQPLTLPHSKHVLRNRIVKAAMTEQMADARHNYPTDALCQASQRFSQSQEGGIAIMITGNVHVDRRYMEATRNVAAEEVDLSDALVMTKWKKWAKACKSHDTIAIVQISHGGRQVPRSVNWNTTVAPSEGAMELAGLPKALPAPFAAPRPLTTTEIHDIMNRFVTAAHVAYQAGFDGVQVHSAHGYLLSTFLSPKVNRRNDEFGGSPENRSRLLLEICRKIRNSLPSTFIVGVKMNSADFQKGGLSEEESIAVSKSLAQIGVDFVEYSGGTYESAVFIKDHNNIEVRDEKLSQNNAGATVRASTIVREAYFIDYVTKARKALKNEPIAIMLTGGWRSARAMHTSLSKDELDLIGIARPLCVEPDFARRLLKWDPSQEKDEVAIVYQVTQPYSFLPAAMKDSVSLQIQSFWHTAQIHRFGKGLGAKMNLPFLPFMTQMMRHLYFDPQKHPKTVFAFKCFIAALLGIVLAVKLPLV